MFNKGFFSIELPRDELNTYFGGGIPKNSLILIEGEDGAGKSVLCQRFAYSLLKKAVTVSYISTELNTLDFIKQMDSIKYSVKNYLLSQDLFFITMTPFLGTVKFEDNFLEKVMESKRLFESEFVIFDTLSFLLLKKNASEGDFYNVINFFRKLNNLNKTVLFTIDPTYLNEQFLTLLRSVVDLYLSLKIEGVGGEVVRVIKIKRFKRPFDLYKNAIPFRVEPKEGLIIEIGGYS
jgi:archaeal flagellar protein FlaH